MMLSKEKSISSGIIPQETFNVRISLLVLIALFFTLFPRIITSLGFHYSLNFFHYFFVFCLTIILMIKRLNESSKKIIILLILFILCVFISYFINKSGFINFIIDVFIIIEPILFLLFIVAIKWPLKSILRFRFWVLGFSFVNLFLCYWQALVLNFGHEEVQGLFLGMGAGAHLAGGMAFSSAIFILLGTNWSRKLRFSNFLLFSLVVVFTDAKQVFAVFLVALLVLCTFKIKKKSIAASYFLIFAIGLAIIYLMAISISPRLLIYLNYDILYAGISQKLSVFGHISGFNDSITNLLFGLGPGHTVSRLAWMLPKYDFFTNYLGATISNVTEYMWHINKSHYLSHPVSGSSMFSLFFFWAGLWGDLGLVGTIVYVSIWVCIYRYFCPDDLSKLLLIAIIVYGGVLTWMEEPGHMLFTLALIGLNYQQTLIVKNNN